MLSKQWVLFLIGPCLLFQIYAADEFFDVNIGSKTYRLEVARTSTERGKGLMHRENLDNKSGMLFVYPKLGDHRIWMKNTLIPLTVIWFNDKAIVTHVQLLQPCVESSCEVFKSAANSKFIIELNSEPHEIRVGDKLSELLKL